MAFLYTVTLISLKCDSFYAKWIFFTDNLSFVISNVKPPASIKFNANLY